MEKEKVGFRNSEGAAIGGATRACTEADRGQIAKTIVVGVKHMQIAGINAEWIEFAVIDHSIGIGITPDQWRDPTPATNGVGILQQQSQ